MYRSDRNSVFPPYAALDHHREDATSVGVIGHAADVFLKGRIGDQHLVIHLAMQGIGLAVQQSNDFLNREVPTDLTPVDFLPATKDKHCAAEWL